MFYGQDSPNIAVESNGIASPLACRGVLITSMGGVASSAFLKPLNEIFQKNTSNVLSNHHSGRDGFKHRPASWWKDHNATSIIGHIGNDHPKVIEEIYSGEQNPCFNKALVIVGDPLHAIESTYRRFQALHINKLRSATGLPPYDRKVPLKQIYEHISYTGKDQTGMGHYVQSWYDASQDRSNWPEIRLVTSRILLDNAASIAVWLGANEEDALAKFSGFHYNGTHGHRRDNSTVPDDLRDQVIKVFENITAIINHIEEAALT